MSDIRKELSNISQHLDEAEAKLETLDTETLELKNQVDLEKLKVGAAICANRQCLRYSQRAIGALYPSSVYCSIRCKYTDENFKENNETYGD